MRIAYVLHLNQRALTGIMRKVSGQISEWHNLGAKVALFLISSDKVVLDHFKDGLGCNTIVSTLYAVHPGIRGLLGRLSAIRVALEKVRMWVPDIVYSRQDFSYPAWKSLSEEFPVILEINTDDLAEHFLISRITGSVHWLTRSLLLARCAGFVFVDEELASKSTFVRFRRPSIVVGNGIDISKINWKPSSPSMLTRLIFIGSGGYAWHGLDKIRSLAMLQQDWQFDIIGDWPIENNCPNIHIWGHLDQNQYENILGNADVAIGTLALHRKQSNSASPLKTREYLAAGLPVIIGYKDVDFPNGAPFLLNIGNFEMNVVTSLLRIDEFVRQWKGHRVKRKSIEHLDWKFKERARLEFMAESSKQWRSRAR